MNQTISADLKLRVKNTLLNNFDIQIVRVLPEDLENLKVFFKRIAPVSTNHKLIRLGNDNDGGYLVPDDLAGVKTCFSPGVSSTADFELDLTKREIKCYLADYSVESAPIDNSLISFEKKFLGIENSSATMTLTGWIDRNAEREDNDLILQMDIEGAEYDVLIETPIDVLDRFRILIIEFHRVDQILNPMGFKLINGVFTKLLNSFRIVHIHANNDSESVNYREFSIPPVLEFTFLRTDRISSFAPTKSFPHELDRPNLPLKNDFPLPGCWYGK